MKKNLAIVTALCISSILFSQKIPSEIFPTNKKDSLGLLKPKVLHLPDSLLQMVKNKNGVAMIPMPNAKPKDSTIYLSLKGKARNDLPYKILNAIPEEKKIIK